MKNNKSKSISSHAKLTFIQNKENDKFNTACKAMNGTLKDKDRVKDYKAMYVYTLMNF